MDPLSNEYCVSLFHIFKSLWLFSEIAELNFGRHMYHCLLDLISANWLLSQDKFGSNIINSTIFSLNHFLSVGKLSCFKLLALVHLMYFDHDNGFLSRFKSVLETFYKLSVWKFAVVVLKVDDRLCTKIHVSFIPFLLDFFFLRERWWCGLEIKYSGFYWQKHIMPSGSVCHLEAKFGDGIMFLVWSEF